MGAHLTIVLGQVVDVDGVTGGYNFQVSLPTPLVYGCPLGALNTRVLATMSLGDSGAQQR